MFSRSLRSIISLWNNLLGFCLCCYLSRLNGTGFYLLHDLLFLFVLLSWNHRLFSIHWFVWSLHLGSFRRSCSRLIVFGPTIRLVCISSFFVVPVPLSVARRAHVFGLLLLYHDLWFDFVLQGLTHKTRKHDIDCFSMFLRSVAARVDPYLALLSFFRVCIFLLCCSSQCPNSHC